ncbi:hypothetical protein GCM10010429_27020 [Micromonospora olivasterospora]
MALRKAVDSVLGDDMRPPTVVRWKAQALGKCPRDGAAPRWFSILTRQSRPAPIVPGRSRRPRSTSATASPVGRGASPKIG